MKSQKTHRVNETRPNQGAAKSSWTVEPRRDPAPHPKPSFDDLHVRITTRAYELYVQRGYREGGSLEDWLDAEREIVSRAFSI
ncbi:DUF2934 domain-containing protein [Petrachloros mirabilis]